MTDVITILISVHDDTLQGLKDCLAYAKGDKSRVRETVVSTEDFMIKCSKLNDDEKSIIEAFVDKLLVARAKEARYH